MYIIYTIFSHCFVYDVNMKTAVFCDLSVYTHTNLRTAHEHYTNISEMCNLFYIIIMNFNFNYAFMSMTLIIQHKI